MDNPIIMFIAAIIVCVAAFIILRNALLWYWQIDKILANLRAIEEHTDDLNDEIRELKDFLIHGVKKKEEESNL